MFNSTFLESETVSDSAEKGKKLLQEFRIIGIMGIKVKVNGRAKTYPEGSTYLDISRDYQKDYKFEIILAMVDGKLVELFKKAEDGVNIKFITVADDPGYKTYQRGAILLMLRAIYRVIDKSKISRVRIENSLGNGLYCEMEGTAGMNAKNIEKVKAEMLSLVERDLPYEKESVSTAKAKKLFADLGMNDKAKLFEYRRTSSTNIYKLDGFIDYYYGFMPPSTGMIKVFDIFKYEKGFMLFLPPKSNPAELAPFEPKKKLHQAMCSATEWGRVMGLDTVADLNDAIAHGNISDLILVQEALMEKRIGDIAEQVKKKGKVKFVMIAGPSSSGKTTFSHRLSIQLRTLGLKPHPIAVDNYFVNREDTPKDEDGNYNFECLEAIDVKQFNKDMTNLLKGKEVELPSFNFKAGKREYKGDFLKLGEDDILVIEGIHCLNDKLSYTLPKESKFKVYISALTELNVDEHNRIPTTDGRIIRRMVRDARTRGTSAAKTIAMWPSVRRGEEENIFPYQETADAMFNSALIYELAVLKQFAEPLLFGIPEDAPEFLEAKRLLKFLDYFLGVTSEDVPKNSVLREFVGGSVFPV